MAANTLPTIATPSAPPTCRATWLTAAPSPAFSVPTSFMIAAVTGGAIAPMPQPTSAVPSNTSAADPSAERNSRGTKPADAVSRPASRTPADPNLATSRPLTEARRPSPRPNGATSRPETNAEPSRTYCTYCGMTNSMPSVAMYTTRITRAPAATRRRASTRTSNSGWRRRSSVARNATPEATPVIAAMITAGLVHPASTPSMSVNTTPPSASVERATPGKSSGGTPGRRDSGSQRSPNGAASSTNGTLTRKTQRQPATSTSSPPTTGPRARPSPATPAQTPAAFDRSSGGKSTANSDSAGGSTQQAAIPISTRAAISSPSVPA